MTTALAELHIHDYGAIDSSAFLSHVAPRDVDWQLAEGLYLAAYGQVSPVRDVIARHRNGDPDANAAFEALFVFGADDGDSFLHFAAKYMVATNGSAVYGYATNRATIEEALAEAEFVCRHICESQRAQGVSYFELRSLLVPMPESGVRKIHEAFLQHLTDASRDGLTARLAISLPREDPWPRWELAKELALGPHGETLTAIDFCAIEEGFPPREKAALFDSVRAFNQEHPDRALAILYHVGESFADKSLESAIRWVHEVAEMGAHRLGHAIALGVNPALYGEHVRSESVSERVATLRYDLAHAEGLGLHGVSVDIVALERELADLDGLPDDERLTQSYDTARLVEVEARQRYAMRGVVASGAIVEICPTSNMRIGGISQAAYHPIHRFLAEGLPFVVATDDPGTFATTLGDELDWAARQVRGGVKLRHNLSQRAWKHRSEVCSGRESAT